MIEKTTSGRKTSSGRDVYLIHSIILQRGIINGSTWQNTFFVCIDDSHNNYLVKTFKGAKNLADSFFDEKEHYRLLFDSSGRVCEFVTPDA